VLLTLQYFVLVCIVSIALPRCSSGALPHGADDGMRFALRVPCGVKSFFVFKSLYPQRSRSSLLFTCCALISKKKGNHSPFPLFLRAVAQFEKKRKRKRKVKNSVKKTRFGRGLLLVALRYVTHAVQEIIGCSCSRRSSWPE
jgi:hypothetical protein